jgi:SprB repeat
MKKLFSLLALSSSLFTLCEAQCPSNLSVYISKVTNVSCHGDSNGVIIATPLDGVAPYTYSWTGIVIPTPPPGSASVPTAAEDSVVTGQPAGTYTVTVTDNCGKTATVTATITQPGPLTAPSIYAVNSDSSIFVVSKPDGALSYSWSATDTYKHTYSGTAINDTIYLFYYLREATLTVSATDSNGCMASTIISIIHPIISSYTPPAHLPYPRWSKRGMYLANANLYIMDTATHLGQDSIVNFCKRNEITYVLLQNLEDFVFGGMTHALSSNKARLLGDFIAMLKDSAGVEEVGVECYDDAQDSTAWNAGYYDIHFVASGIMEYNWNFAADRKVDVVSMDDEFMYAGIYPDSSAAIAAFHNTHMAILRELYQASRECPANFLKVEDYLEEPTDPANSSFDPWDPVEVMEKDSIAMYADRIQNSCYSAYPNALYNEADFIMTYPVFGSDSIMGIDSIPKTIELWPAFDPADSTMHTTCTKCWDPISPANYLGDSLCSEHKTPDYMEERYYDSLAYSEKIKKFTDNGNTYTQFPMGGDTNFTIGGSFWFQYYCLRQVQNFDTGAASALKFYVSLGPNIQWFYPNVMPPRPITLTAKVRGGTPPFNYVWYNDSDRSVLQSSSSNTLIVPFIYPSFPKKISVLAIDADTLAATDYVNIYQMCEEPPIDGPVKPGKNSGNVQTTDLTSFPIKLYPNPNNGSFTLEYTLTKGEEGKLVLFNEIGMQVGEYNLEASENKMNITNYNLSNEVYIYQVWINNEPLQRGRIIIIK